MKEFICKTCHRHLRKHNHSALQPKMPSESIASPIKGGFTCQLCNYNGPRKYCCEFNEKTYNHESVAVKNALKKIKNHMLPDGNICICRKCHNKLLNASTISCLCCSNIVERACAVTCRKSKYTSCNVTKFLSNVSLDSNLNAMYVCRCCDAKLLGNIFVCICCSRNVDKKATVVFKMEKYDHNNDVVRNLLSEAIENCSSNQKQYICKTCHSNLRIQKNRQPTLPKVMQQPKYKSTPGQKFLNAVKNKPEFVCTCCHHWLF